MLKGRQNQLIDRARKPACGLQSYMNGRHIEIEKREIQRLKRAATAQHP